MGTEAELVRKPPLTTAFSATECHMGGPAFLCCRSEAFVHGASPFCFAVQYSGSAWHGWSLAILRLEGAGFWLSMAWVEPACVLDSGSAWQGWSLASDLSVLRPRPCWELVVPQDGPESGSGG